MKFQIHTAIGHDAPPAPPLLDTHEAARAFVAALADLFQVEPARVIHDEYRAAGYVWTNVTVALPTVGEAVFTVDSRKAGPEALGLYLENKAVQFAWAESENIGQMLAQAIRAAACERAARTARQG
ncbi:hypothetical protein [Streptomyces candidus]|uniref:Uncharacterized protein n=1 Tax=Streptomyces candidus TaxID=67283 RepID=A0A7X0LTG8_9ACTN|nr:hypothetical protein [Streptomyces candidus]MBB6440262.1 hypothetical protein [Streptomyces candidus]GHH58212.1 hypothetical protein GCM10018773_66310 [Streptomyces candidus]